MMSVATGECAKMPIACPSSCVAVNARHSSTPGDDGSNLGLRNTRTGYWISRLPGGGRMSVPPSHSGAVLASRTTLNPPLTGLPSRTTTSAVLDVGHNDGVELTVQKAAFHWSMPPCTWLGRFSASSTQTLTGNRISPVKAEGIGRPRACGDDAPPLVPVGATWRCDVGTGQRGHGPTQAKKYRQMTGKLHRRPRDRPTEADTRCTPWVPLKPRATSSSVVKRWKSYRNDIINSHRGNTGRR